MESPIPVLIFFLLVGSMVYQLFFRYEHWTGGEQKEITYERDNITGETHLIRPGDKISFIGRLLGDFSVKHKRKDEDKASEKDSEDSESIKLVSSKDGDSEEATTLSMIEEPDQKKKAETKSAPVPNEVLHGEKETLDFNGDGTVEQILQTKTANDGLIDISVISNGKELFYGRGKSLMVLPTKKSGWSDLALNVSQKEKLIFHYNPSTEGYEAVDQE